MTTTRWRRILFTGILCCLLFALGSRKAAAQELRVELNLDAERHLVHPDSLVKVDPEKIDRDWITLLKHRKLDINDTTVSYPKFVRFCLDVYLWADRTFNSYDTTYVVPHKKRGKVKLVNDNWVDFYTFHPREAIPLTMSSNVYPSLGLYAQYGILSVGYSLDINTILYKDRPNTKRLDFSFSTAVFHLEWHYWDNRGGNYIRDFGNYRRQMNDGRMLRFSFDGLKFRGSTLSLFHFINHRKYSYGAAYNTSNIQKKTAGTWVVGIEGATYKARFDFADLPKELLDYYNYPLLQYSLHYNSINAAGGYAINWVCNSHLLFNATLLPKLGVCFSYADTTLGKKALLSSGADVLLSLNYHAGRWFAGITSNFKNNAYFTQSLGFMLFTESLQVSAGLRF